MDDGLAPLFAGGFILAVGLGQLGEGAGAQAAECAEKIDQDEIFASGASPDVESNFAVVGQAGDGETFVGRGFGDGADEFEHVSAPVHLAGDGVEGASLRGDFLHIGGDGPGLITELVNEGHTLPDGLSECEHEGEEYNPQCDGHTPGAVKGF